jgi:2-amino-4-hydroxy-6-hydroxymethyldihydropteridine diphosphokinase
LIARDLAKWIGDDTKNMSTIPVLLAFGSNLGDRQRTIELAWERIAAMPNIKAMRLSPLYETEPVGGPAKQPMYLNAAGVIETTLPPEKLLETLQEIETHFGRVRSKHWDARTLDIDILLYGSETIKTATLTIPHPEMLRRLFVLEPANDVAASWGHPQSGKTVGEHLLLIAAGSAAT